MKQKRETHSHSLTENPMVKFIENIKKGNDLDNRKHVIQNVE